MITPKRPVFQELPNVSILLAHATKRALKRKVSTLFFFLLLKKNAGLSVGGPLGKSLSFREMTSNGCSIERDSISRIEIGTRFVPDYELPVFSKVLNVSVDWFLGLQ